MAYAIKVYPTIPSVLGTSPSNVLSIDFNITQYGGTFDIVLIGRNYDYGVSGSHVVYQFDPNDLVNVFGPKQGIISDVTTPIGRAGILTRVFGEFVLPHVRIVRAKTYMDSNPFRVPGGDINETEHIVNNALLYEDDPSITFIRDMTFSNLFQRICIDHGFNAFFLGPYINYPIYRFVLSPEDSLLEVLDDLAKHAACNVVAEGLGVNVIPWGGSPTVSVQLQKKDLQSDFSYTRDRSNYNSILLKSGSEITPYNSSYIGKPERIASLSFKAGPLYINDITVGANNLADTKQWEYPKDIVTYDPEQAINEDTVNVWFGVDIIGEVEKDGDNAPVPFPVYGSTLVSRFWDFEVERVGSISYRSFYEQLSTNNNIIKPFTDQALKEQAITYATQYEYTKSRVLVLMRWSRVRALVEGVGDIHPYVYVLPSNVAPEITALDDYSVIPDRQELSLVSLGETNPILISGFEIETFSFSTQTPDALTGIVPDGKGFRASFNADGSIYVDAVFNEFRRKKLGIGDRRISYSFYPNSVIKLIGFGSNSVVLTMKKDHSDGYVLLNGGIDDGTDYADKFIRALSSFSPLIVHSDHTSQASWDPDTSVETVNEEIRKDRKPLLVTDNIAKAYAEQDRWMKRSFYVRSMSADVDEGIASRVKVIVNMTTPASEDISHSIHLAKANTSHVTTNLGKLVSSASGNYLPRFTDSGLSQDNNEPITGSWTLYGLRRKMYPATFYKSSSKEKLSFIGVLDYLNDDIQDPNPGPNVKYVTSPLITDIIDENSSHIIQLGRALYQEIDRNVNLFSVTYAMTSSLLSSIPHIGATVAMGNIRGTIVNVSGSINRSSGATITLTTGRLPIL